MQKVKMFLRDRLDELWNSSVSTGSTDVAGARWKGAQGQTPFWAEPAIMSSWVLDIDDKMLLNPFSCLWADKVSDDAIFSGGGEAGSSSGQGCSAIQLVGQKLSAAMQV